MRLNLIYITLLFLLPLNLALAENATLNPDNKTMVQVSALIEPAIQFTQSCEHRAFLEGRRLSDNEKAIARSHGINKVELIKIVDVNEIPFPKTGKLAYFSQQVGLRSSEIIGLTCGYGIFLKKGKYSQGLVAHELVHVQQYEELSIEGFIKRYFLEVASNGFMQAPLEVEATKKSAKFY